jgi:hypothetical protein
MNNETLLQLKKIATYNRISKIYDKKAVVYGDEVDLFEYKTTKITFKQPNRSNLRKKKGLRRIDSISRTRQAIYRLVSMNCGEHGDFPPVFFTITFKENIEDLAYANSEFKKFIQRLNYFFDKKLKYVFVPEFQKRGAVHYHGIFFNIPFIDKNLIEDIWGHGFTRIETTSKVKDMSAYISKYLSKETFDKRLFGQRIILSSRGLKRPVEIYGGYEVDEYLSSVKIIDETQVYKSLPCVYKKLKLCKKKH